MGYWISNLDTMTFFVSAAVVLSAGAIGIAIFKGSEAVPSTLLRELSVGVIAAAGTVVAIFALLSVFFQGMTNRYELFIEEAISKRSDIQKVAAEVEERQKEIQDQQELLDAARDTAEKELAALSTQSSLFRAQAEELQSLLAATE